MLNCHYIMEGSKRTIVGGSYLFVWLSGDLKSDTYIPWDFLISELLTYSTGTLHKSFAACQFGPLIGLNNIMKLLKYFFKLIKLPFISLNFPVVLCCKIIFCYSFLFIVIIDILCYVKGPFFNMSSFRIIQQFYCYKYYYCFNYLIKECMPHV